MGTRGNGSRRTRVARGRVVRWVGGGIAAALVVVSAPSQPVAAVVPTQLYIVQFAETAPLNGLGLNAVADLGIAPTYTYSHTIHGVALALTPAQAAALRARPGVAAVDANQIVHVASDGATDQRKASTTAGTPAAPAAAPGTAVAVGGVTTPPPVLAPAPGTGEDMIVGVIDTGIWPEADSFSDHEIRNGHAFGPIVYSKPPSKWHGTCQAGQLFTAHSCNNKLVGARYFSAGMDAEGDFPPTELHSPRDVAGHGTQVAAIAAGNRGVRASLSGTAPIDISGVAPRARIASYKALFADFGTTVDIVAAIDQAVADGVDVINMSLGAPAFGVITPLDMAVVRAESAGVVVVAAAGNATYNGTVINPATGPWAIGAGALADLTTWQGSVVLGNGTSVTGFSRSAPLGTHRLVDGASAGAAACDAPLDRRVVLGRIVMCRVPIFNTEVTTPGEYVQRAGGVGMVLIDDSDTRFSKVVHEVPAVRLDPANGDVVAAYLATAGARATARLAPQPPVAAPLAVGVFSSRGPMPGVAKPDIVAPGTGMLTANAPTRVAYTNRLQPFAVVRGTSFASPYTAGVVTLIRRAHPDWSPAEIRSALITTADPSNLINETIGTPATRDDAGGGIVHPRAAMDPGLVFDTPAADHQAVIDGTLSEADLNEAAIYVDQFQTPYSTTRTVTNVGATGTYTATVDSPAGFDVSVSPSTLTLAHGQQGSFTITVSGPADPDPGSYDGSITWTDGAHHVRSPLEVFVPVPLPTADAPYEVDAVGSPGIADIDMTFHYSGALNAYASSVTPADQTPGTVVDDPANDYATALASGVGVTSHTISVTAPFLFDLRVALYDDRVDGATDDLDLYVYDPGGNLIGVSGGATAQEVLDIPYAAPGDYRVDVHGYETDGPDANYILYSWQMDGNYDTPLPVSGPSPVVRNQTAPVRVEWPALDPNRYAVIIFQSGGSFLGDGGTLLMIDAEPPARHTLASTDFETTGASGKIDVPVDFGYDGDFTAVARGMVPSTVYSGSLDPGEIVEYDFDVPPGYVVRAGLYASEISGASVDIELLDDNLFFSRFREETADHVTETLPLDFAGPHHFFVYQPDGSGPATYTAHVWLIPLDGSGSTATAPATAVNGTTGTVNVAWSGLQAGQRYSGMVTYHSTNPTSLDDGFVGQTFIDVQT
jgi:hypothetical protein